MKRAKKDRNEEKVTIVCDGGCGRTVTLRKSRVRKADYYICHSRESGDQCEKMLPARVPGMVRVIDMQAAANFWGYTDEWPDEETAASVARACEILAAAVAQQAIAKAKECS